MMGNSKGDSFKDKLNGGGLYWLSQIILKTAKISINNKKYIPTALDVDRPVIFTGWHGITMMAVPLVQYCYTDFSRFVIIMPDDWRGKALRIWAEKVKATPFPMNLEGDNTMGMARSLARLMKKVSEGMNLYINPDGPDGPAHVIKPGIVFIARKTKAIIVPIGAYCRSAYIVPRWDRYSVPYPFSKISYHIGEPIESLPEDASEAEQLITNTLNRVTLQAAADYYERG
ncbi:MAG: hypothetical protein P8Y68_15540 [Anaerolineales bacterium]